MIIKMHKVTLLTLASEREEALAALRELGVMHLDAGKLRESGDRVDLAAAAGHVDRVITYLGTLDTRKMKKGHISNDVDAVLADVGKLSGEKERLTRELDASSRRIEQLEKWGEFDSALLDKLRDSGVYVYLCEAPRAVFENIASGDAAVREISRNGDQVAFAVISHGEIAAGTLPLAPLPQECSLEKARSTRRACIIGLREAEDKLRVIAANDMELLRAHAAVLNEKLDFLNARDAMSEHGEIAVLSGFVPEDRMEEFKLEARRNSWAYIANPADESSEPVPTLVRIPKWARMVAPLFDFLGIVPGYSEVDASAIVLVFFTIFFGILIGDAGYGAIFALIAFPATFMTRGRARLTFGFVALLSCSAIAWGVLTNNYFGCSLEAMKGLECPALASSAKKDANVQFVCFTLGLIQLSLGHFWRMVLDGRWRNVGSQIGWLSIMVANFFLIRTMIVYSDSTEYPAFMLPCYIAGILLVAICEVHWNDPGSVLGFPFSLINSFVDLLSYIRLFAVGLASYYLAYSFNGIGRDLIDSGALGVPVGMIVLLFGHLLNIGLGILAVLVHGVRLNTLEFSSHVGLQWGGFAFRAFAKNTK